MNRVQTVTQKQYRVENQVENPSRVHKQPTGPVGPAFAHRLRARGRVVGSLAVSWSGPSAVSQRFARASRTSAPCALLGPACREPRALVSASCRGLWLPCLGLVLGHSPAAHYPCCHNTIFFLRYKFPQPAILPQYKPAIQSKPCSL